MPDTKPTPPKGGFMSKKIGPVPLPIAVLAAVLVGLIAYRHFKNSSVSGTSGTSTSGSAAVDPNAIDPNTGLTYGAEEQAATGALGAGASTNGTGAGGAAGGMSVGDLEGLLQALQGFGGTTNYYYGGGGSGAEATPTNPTGPGNAITATQPPIQIFLPTSAVSPNYSPPAPIGPSPSTITPADYPQALSPVYSTTPTQAFGAVPAGENIAIAKAAEYSGSATPNLQLGTPAENFVLPSYGLTYGPPAGQRATKNAKGQVESIH